MDRFSKSLMLLGALCFLAAGISIGFTLAAPAGALAAGAQTLGTATPPPQPTAAPSAIPTQTAPTAIPTQTAPTTVPNQTMPSATPAQPAPSSTPRPRRTHTQPEPTQQAEPSVTPDAPTTDVEISKQVSQASVQPGQTFVYTLVARNLGATNAPNVVVIDQVPEQLEVIDLASTKGDIALSGQTVSAYPSLLAAGEVAEYRITVRARPNAMPGTIANTGRISTSASGDAPGNNASTALVELRGPQAAPAQKPPRLPRTAEDPPAPALAVLATITPLAWMGIYGGLLLALGAVLSWGLRGWLRGEASGRNKLAEQSPNAARAFRLPQAGPAGPPRLGAELPAAAAPAPLPPLIALDRDDALRDAARGDGEL